MFHEEYLFLDYVHAENDPPDWPFIMTEKDQPLHAAVVDKYKYNEVQCRRFYSPCKYTNAL